MKLQALRGATTSLSNSIEAIEESVSELVSELINRNKLDSNQIISMVFSVTRDLDACFPAAIARRQSGLESVALLDCQQMFVKGDLKFCIRVLAHVWIPHDQLPQHTYLGKANKLRPDL